MSVSQQDNEQSKRSQKTNGRIINSHSTSANIKNRWSTHRIAIYAMFVALTILVSFFSFPIFPLAPFLTYDPSGIVVLIAGFSFGPTAAVIVSILGFAPHLFSNFFGACISILVALALSVPASYIYRKKPTRIGAFAGILVGAFTALVVALACNIVVTPLYAQMSVQEVINMILPILLPFNIIKFTIHGVVTFLIYKPISNIINR